MTCGRPFLHFRCCHWSTPTRKPSGRWLRWRQLNGCHAKNLKVTLLMNYCSVQRTSFKLPTEIIDDSASRVMCDMWSSVHEPFLCIPLSLSVYLSIGAQVLCGICGHSSRMEDLTEFRFTAQILNCKSTGNLQRKLKCQKVVAEDDEMNISYLASALISCNNDVP